MRWILLLFLAFPLLVNSLQVTIQKKLSKQGKNFNCKFSLTYTRSAINKKRSKVTCKPNKKMNNVKVILEAPNGFRFIGLINIKPTKIVRMTVKAPAAPPPPPAPSTAKPGPITEGPSTTTEWPFPTEGPGPITEGPGPITEEPGPGEPLPFATIDAMFKEEYNNISTDEKPEHFFCGQEIKEKSEVNATNTRGYTLKNTQLWANGIIGWSFVSNGDDFKQYGFMTDQRIGLSQGDVQVVMKAMKQIEEKTCIKFQFVNPKKGAEWLAITRESTSGTNQCQGSYIKSTYTGRDVKGLGNVFWPRSFGRCFGGAYAFLGARPMPGHNNLFVISATTLTDTQNSVGLCVHELLHNLGVGHTQKRPDQRQNIKVMWNNIVDGQYSQFEQCEGARCDTRGTPYDCSSIMHYSDRGFSKNGQPTMVPLYPNRCELKSYKNRLSATDITLLKKMYCVGKPEENTVTSPNFPDNYPDKQNVRTPIDAGSGKVVEIKFTDMDIEAHETCGYDYVKIIDADNSVLLAESCGKTLPKKVTSKSQTVTIIFISDSNINAKGFRIEWKAVQKVNPVDGNWSSWSIWSRCGNNRNRKGDCRKQQIRNCNNPPASNGGKECQGKKEKIDTCSASDLSPPSNHPDCVIEGVWSKWGSSSACNSDCRSTRTRTCTNPKPVNYKSCDGDSSETEACTGGACGSTDNGEVTSPHYPKNYPDSQSTQRRIDVEEGSTIKLTFTDFNIEYHASCIYDYVLVLDTDGSQLAKLCGETIPTPILSTGKTLTVLFYSDTNLNKKGFRAEWTKMASEVSERAIKSPGYPANYPDKTTETYNLDVPSGSRVKLTFTDFDLEFELSCSYDYVEILDTDWTSLKKLCGNTKPSNVYSTGNSMTVKFVSDYDTNKKGFRATWTKIITCYENGWEYNGGGLQPDPMVPEKVTSPEDCQLRCQQRDGCVHFTWVNGENSFDDYKNTCWLKGPQVGRREEATSVSGPRDC